MDSLVDSPAVISSFIEKYGTQLEVCSSETKVINGKFIKKRS